MPAPRTEPSPVRNSQRPATRSTRIEPSPLEATTFALRGRVATIFALRE